MDLTDHKFKNFEITIHEKINSPITPHVKSIGDPHNWLCELIFLFICKKIAYRIIPGKKVLVKRNWYFFTWRWLIVVTRQHVSDVVKIILPWFILIGITPNAAEEGAENTNQVHCSAKPCKSLEKATGNQVSMLTLYYIHFEITCYPCNLIGSQQCDLFPNRTIFCSKSHLFLSQWEQDSKTKLNQSDLTVSLN